MRYSQMSEEQRHQLLDDAEHYPLRVSFLSKQALLSQGEVAFLRRNGVDFDVDDAQIAEIQAELAEEGEAPAPPRGLILRGLGALAAAVVILSSVFRPARGR